jgi:protein ImuA
MYTNHGGFADVEDRSDRTICLEELRQRIARLEEGGQCGGHTTISSGCPALDHSLPGRGFRRGTLIEWLSAGEGTGAWTLALLAAREACRNGGMLVVLDRGREFCPPAAVRLGIELEQLVVVHAESAADHDWAMDQVLRSPVVAAVLAWPEKLTGRTFRRWQLAAEEGGTLGLLLRPERMQTDPSWADVRLWVEPLPNIKPRPVVSPRTATTGHGFMGYDKRRLRIVLLRCRRGTDGRLVEVELDDETCRMRPVMERRLQIAN